MSRVAGHAKSLFERFGRSLGSVVLVVSLVISSIALVNTRPVEAEEIDWIATELLGKATDDSITINVVPADDVEIRYLVGTSPGSLTPATSFEAADGGDPYEVTISGLSPNTEYFYQMEYRAASEPGVSEFRDIYSFRTARASGSPFTFTVISDSHLNAAAGGGSTGAANYMQATLSIESDYPDLHFDLGDTFMVDYAASETVNAYEEMYLNQREMFGNFAHSTPVYLAEGNHEEEEGWNLDDTPFSRGLTNIEMRKAFFPTPTPDDAPFYTANADTLSLLSGDQYRENYYAFDWGDALFVVIDPFQYTLDLPYSPTAGEENDEGAPTGDQWTWTLGQEQFEWLRDVLDNSDQPFKFVMSHHVTGGLPGVDYVRGGLAAADYFEWGGDNENGTDGWAANRPGWGSRPIHQIMLDAEVTAYFHGHDHQYAYEEVTGTKTGGGSHTIVYQEVPQPSAPTGFGASTGGYSDAGNNERQENAGYLRLSLDPDTCEVSSEYVRVTTGTETPHEWTADGVGCDGGGGNTPPVAANDSTTVDENGSVDIDVLDNDNDGGDGPSALSVVSVSNPPNGSATNNGDDVTYEPDTDYCGGDSFTYTVSDGEDTDSASVSVTVTCDNTPENDPPSASGKVVITEEDTAVGFTLTASDPDGDSLTYQIVDGPDHGALTGSGASRTYTPDGGFVGSDSFTFRVYDGEFYSNVATVNISVNPGDGPGPQPSSGTFIDDDGNTHEGNIEAIAAEGITQGCNPPTNNLYCPSDDVTRGQMAAFIVRALGLTDDGGKDWFVDDNGNTFENDINKLATSGITRGCNPPANTEYCPGESVTRGQMAAFIVRALGLTDDGGKDWFVDDNGNTFENDINKLAAAGITAGCNPPVNDRYCPDNNVKRDQMASFLARALGLDPIIP